jgi:hypothetical protein
MLLNNEVEEELTNSNANSDVYLDVNNSNIVSKSDCVT